MGNAQSNVIPPGPDEWLRHIQAIKDSDNDVRKRAIKILSEMLNATSVPRPMQYMGKIKDTQGVIPLIEALKDSDKMVRQMAGSALGRIGDTQAVLPLIEALKDGDQSVQGSAATALGQIGDNRAVMPLIKIMNNNDDGIRADVAEALGNIGDVRAVLPLSKALKDSDFIVRLLAVEALGKIGDTQAVFPLIEALSDSDSTVNKRAFEVLVLFGEASISYLIEALNYSDEEVRCNAIRVMEEIGPKDARTVMALTEVLKDSNKDVRFSAVRQLGEIGDAQVVLPLITALKDYDYYMRKEAFETLGKIGEPAVLPLIEVLKDNDNAVRRFAAETLGKIRDIRALFPLIAMLKDRDEHVQYNAAVALGAIRDPRAVRSLLKALPPDNHDRVLSYWTIHTLVSIEDESCFGYRGVEPLIEALNDRSIKVRRVAADALLLLLGDISTLPFCILGCQQLTPAQKCDALEALRKVKPQQGNGISVHYPIGSLTTFCESLCQKAEIEPEIRDGAEAILKELQRRIHSATLLRPGDRDTVREQEQLLRPAASAENSVPAEELVRGSQPPAEVEETTKRNLLSRIRK